MIIDYYNIINLSIKLTLEYDTYVVYFSFSGYTVFLLIFFCKCKLLHIWVKKLA